MSPSPVYGGVDVSKDTLDLSLPEHPPLQVDNTPSGVRKLLARVALVPGAILCCEASGGYEQTLLEACWEQGQPVALVMANRVRQWALSQGILAKTDRLDARAIASFATASQPRLLRARSPHLARLRDLVRRRDFEVQRRSALRHRLPHEQQPDLRRLTQAQLRAAHRRIARLDQWIDQLIDSQEDLRHLDQRLRQPKGIGRVTSATVMAELPALGQLGGQAVAAWCGLAPYNHDSGPYRGRRRIRGGNAYLRRAFYLAALSASCYNPILRPFYQRLLSRGKDSKLALIAVARKLSRLLERIAADPNFEPVC